MVITLSAALCALLSGNASSCACSCARVPSVKDSFDEATIVFLGKLVAFDATSEPPSATFDVDTTAKGVLPDNQEKVLNTDRSSCVMMQWFDEESLGSEYLVYSFVRKDDANLEMSVKLNPYY
jgi:hypothetical protein